MNTLCPGLPTRHAGEADEPAAAASVALDSFWPEGPAHARTEVRIAWNAGELLVRAEIEDEDITTRATSDSQQLWQLGDVFEIFLEAEDAGYYTELHVTPGNHRLHLRLGHGDHEAIKSKTLALCDRTIHPPGFTSQSAVNGPGWTVEARIPAALVDPAGSITTDSRWRASFCRYDAWSDGRPAVLSSTSAHEVLNFHRRHEWRPLCF